MKLRNFLYLNSKIIEDYLSAIDGYIYDEESLLTATTKENEVSAKVGIPVISGGGTHVGKQNEEIKRSVKISNAAKFDKIYKYLQANSELKFFENLSENEYLSLNRDDFIEVLATARFTKMKELSDNIDKLGSLAIAIQGLTEHNILDNKTMQAINGFSALDRLKSESEITCVFNFENGEYPLISYLNDNYFLCERDSFIGQSYLLCKVLRKIQKGQSVKLDEIFGNIKNLSLNREQRRKMPKNIDNPDIIKDVIKGPALIVLPIAVYQ